MVTRLRKQIPQDVEDELLEKENVVAVGRGRKRIDGKLTDEEVIVTFVEKKVDEDELDEEDVVPDSLDIDDESVQTDVQEAPGGFFAQQQQPTQVPVSTSAEASVSPRVQRRGGALTQRPQQVTGPFGETRKDRWRPQISAGVSIGHPDITAGTLGSPPLRTEDDDVVFLTNAHVAAPAGKAKAGDPILQPGKYDGGENPQDKIGELLEWSELSEDDVNTSDSALVQITGNVENDILGVSDLRGWKRSSYEVQHYKSGRTTGTTSADLIARDVTAKVNYGGSFSKPLRFSGLEAFEAFSAGGDSGSLIGVEDEDGFHGTSLLFAGSSQQTLGIPIDAVQAVHGKLEPLKQGTSGGEPGEGGPTQAEIPGINPEGPPELEGREEMASVGAEPETQAAAQKSYTGLTGTLSGNQTLYRWHGAWHPGYTVHFSARPTTSGRAVRSDVHYVYKSSNGYLYYLLRLENVTNASTGYEVRVSYEYSQ
jgi:hypothetical protein